MNNKIREKITCVEIDQGNHKCQRKAYLDNIRWITVVIVVIYHVIYMYNGVQPFGVLGAFHENQIQDGFMYFVYPWFMALLFVVSGMSARFYLENKGTEGYVRIKTRKLLVPSTIGLFAFQWILGYFNMQIGGGAGDFSAVPAPIFYLIMAVSGTGPLWYIQMLWIFSLLLLLVRKVEKERLWKLGEKTPVWLVVCFAVVVYGAAQVLNTPIVTVYRFGIYGFCFFVGYFVFSHEDIIDRLGNIWWLLDVAAMGLGIAYTVLYFGENYAVEPTINNVLACVYCWTAILAIFATMKKFGDKTTAFTAWMSSKAWGLYIFHYLPLAVCAIYLNQYLPDLPAILVYFIVGVSAFVGAYVLNEAISRIPVLRWCVLGIKKEKNSVSR